MPIFKPGTPHYDAIRNNLRDIWDEYGIPEYMLYDNKLYTTSALMEKIGARRSLKSHIVHTVLDIMKDHFNTVKKITAPLRSPTARPILSNVMSATEWAVHMMMRIVMVTLCFYAIPHCIAGGAVAYQHILQCDLDPDVRGTWSLSLGQSADIDVFFETGHMGPDVLITALQSHPYIKHIRAIGRCRHYPDYNVTGSEKWPTTSDDIDSISHERLRKFIDSFLPFPPALTASSISPFSIFETMKFRITFDSSLGYPPMLLNTIEVDVLTQPPCELDNPELVNPSNIKYCVFGFDLTVCSVQLSERWLDLPPTSPPPILYTQQSLRDLSNHRVGVTAHWRGPLPIFLPTTRTEMRLTFLSLPPAQRRYIRYRIMITYQRLQKYLLRLTGRTWISSTNTYCCHALGSLDLFEF